MGPVLTRDVGSVRDLLRRGRRCLSGVFIISFAVNVLMLAAPLFMMQVFDRVLTSRSIETLIYLAAITLFALGVMAMLDMVRARMMAGLGVWLDRQLGGPVLAGMIRTPANASSTSTRGVSVPNAEPVRDIAIVRNFLTGHSVYPLLDAPWTPVFLVIVFLLHPILGWIATSGALVLIILVVLGDLANRAGGAQGAEATSRALRVADSAVSNASVARAMGLADRIVQRWHVHNDSALEVHLRSAGRTAAVGAAARFTRFALQIVLLAAGAWLVIHGSLNAGAMIAASILVARALAPVEQMVSSWRLAVAAQGAVKRLKQLPRPPAPRAMKMPKPRGKLDVENLSFAYPGQERLALRNISFELQPGETLGIIGSTASGKSTLASLLVGSLSPQMGCVRLDGVDMARWGDGDRGPNIGYLPQGVELFDGTVGENIGRLDGSDDTGIIAAAKAAGVHVLVLSLPDGYDTAVGPNGMILSGGQRQRIALARALYGSPAFIVLDEPNANLDGAGELALGGALKALRASKTTTVVIAHRPQILGQVDRILHLDSGRVVRFGPRDEVLASLSASASEAAQRSKVVRLKGAGS